MTESALKRYAGWLGSHKRGVKERPSAIKQAGCRKAIVLANLVKAGKHEEAALYRAKHYPEKMRERELRRSLGQEPEKK